MRTLLWSLIIVVAVLAVSSSVYTCGYQQDRLEYVLTDEMIVTNSNLKASEHATDNGDEHVMETHIKPGRLTGLFNDSNAMQLEAARANGIDPITDVRSAFKLKRPIVRLYTCDVYYIDSTMKYAHPYLVPKAATRDWQGFPRHHQGARRQGLPNKGEQPAAHRAHCGQTQKAQRCRHGAIVPPLRHHVRHQLDEVRLP